MEKTTVLCIDDDSVQLALTRAVLERRGFQVLIATSAEEGLGILHSTSVDIVVLDYWLNGNKGTAVSREFREAFPEIPIVVLSGYSPLPGEGGGMVDDWVVKGGGAENLGERLLKVLALRKPRSGEE